MLRNVIYIIASMLFFFSGIVAYGIILNLNEKPLEVILKEKNITGLKNVTISIDRKNYKLSLFSDTTLIKNYNVVFGRNNNSNKISKTDNATPVGSYFICKIDTNNIYYKKLFLNYPNLQDASEALKENIISQNEFKSITKNLDQIGCSFAETKLGADIGIQGTGEYNIVFKNLPFVFNWTNGSIALSNENIDELLSVVTIGTKVYIKN
ncbi:MAG: L,D-transpeptidase [Ignavibacteriae bacterium]|jgi:murein L,D-transpeptidase YafK|nr:L,D-transpeptidase [Ignavibacteriota bacterium]